jgi:hypothetical protein
MSMLGINLPATFTAQPGTALLKQLAETTLHMI